ncbi:3'-5' exonuclease [Psychrobacter sp. DM4]|uniref:3'-5' exonuclease n=1 Tax=Psychrobacter sp. DM4 TaxID=3440637 RepID=UPI003F4F54C3
MEHKSFYTKTRTAHAHVIGLKGSQGETLVVSVNSVKTGKKLNLYKLPLELKNQVAKIKSYSAFVAFAKANQIADIVADEKQTSCPAPAPAPAKSAAKGQGIFIYTETTGLDRDAEIVEIAVVDENENILFESLVKPTKPISKAATDVHGITNADVKDAPSFAEIWAKLSSLIGTKTIVFYNADFDTRMIRQSVASAFDSPIPKEFTDLFPHNKTFCLMQFYARNYGRIWSDYHHSYRWTTLTNACTQQRIDCRDVPNHRAAGDAIKTARLYRKVKQLQGVA